MDLMKDANFDEKVLIDNFDKLTIEEKLKEMFNNQIQLRQQIIDIKTVKAPEENTTIKKEHDFDKLVELVCNGFDSYWSKRNEKIIAEIKGANDKEQKFHSSFLMELLLKLVITAGILAAIVYLALQKVINDPSNLFVLIITLVFSTSLIEFSKGKSKKNGE